MFCSLPVAWLSVSPSHAKGNNCLNFSWHSYSINIMNMFLICQDTLTTRNISTACRNAFLQLELSSIRTFLISSKFCRQRQTNSLFNGFEHIHQSVFSSICFVLFLIYKNIAFQISTLALLVLRLRSDHRCLASFDLFLYCSYMGATASLMRCRIKAINSLVSPSFRIPSTVNDCMNS